MPLRRRVARAVWSGLAVGALVLAGCAGGDDVSPDTTLSFGPQACAPSEPSLVVDQIDDAVAAVEAELGGPQLYFEINATPLLVNLFVADASAATVTPFAYVGGELSSEAAIEGATGNAFVASAIDLDPQLVLSCVTDQLPASVLDVFFVEGGPEGAVKYTVLTSNEQGGQLSVEVTGEGLILAVDTI